MKTIVIYCCASCTVFLFTSVGILCGEEGNLKPTTQPAGNDTKGRESPTRQLLKYEVLEEQIVEQPLKGDLYLSVQIKGTITKQELRKLLESLYNSYEIRKAFQFHPRISHPKDVPTSVFIGAFLSREHFESDRNICLARLDRNADHDETKISFHEGQLKDLKNRPQARFGLSEEKRKRLFFEQIQEIDERAFVEAERRLPSLTRNGEIPSEHQVQENWQLLESLQKEYRLQFVKRHGINSEQLDAVISEGEDKGWPIAPMSKEAKRFFGG